MKATETETGATALTTEPRQNGPTLLQAHDLHAAYGTQQVLRDIRLSIAAGECLALIGPNGAGKSSLLRVLAGLLPATAGSIAIAGKPLSAWRPDALAKQRGYLSQHAGVQWPLPVHEVVALGRLPFGNRQLTPSDEQIIDAAMMAADVQALAERPVTTLSEGERARVLIARLFATEAPLLLADEPTAALDLAHQHQVMQLFRQHCQAGGAAILVLHDLNLAARYCDRVLLLQHGAMVSQGSPAQVLTATQLAAVYGIDSEVLQRGEHLQLLFSPR